MRDTFEENNGLRMTINMNLTQSRLNEGRIVKPDGALKAIFPVAKLDMLQTKMLMN